MPPIEHPHFLDEAPEQGFLEVFRGREAKLKGNIFGIMGRVYITLVKCSY